MRRGGGGGGGGGGGAVVVKCSLRIFHIRERSESGEMYVASRSMGCDGDSSKI